MGRRIASSLFFAALLALLAWALITGGLKKYLTGPLQRLGLLPAAQTVDGTVDEDVLFDDDSTVDWSDPVSDTDTDVFESEQYAAGEGASSYELLLNPDYFNALLDKYATDLPIADLRASFESGRVILAGNAKVADLTALFQIPSGVVLFLPETVPCRLSCVPRVEDGRIRVSVTEVQSDYSVLSPFLSRDGILSSVEGFLNDQIKKYLSSNYIMKTATVSSGGLKVAFSVEKSPET